MACFTPISLDQFARGLATQPTQPVSLVTRTEPRMKKRGNPFSERGVVRVAGRTGFIGADYERVVNRQREREGQPVSDAGELERFDAVGLWGGAGEHVAGNRHLVRHKRSGELYLVFFPQADATKWDRYETVDTQELLDADAVKPWLAESGTSTRQGTDKQILWRTIALSSIARIRLNGQLYALDQKASLLAIDERVLALVIAELPQTRRGQLLDNLPRFVLEEGELPPPDEDMLELAQRLLEQLRPRTNFATAS